MELATRSSTKSRRLRRPVKRSDGLARRLRERAWRRVARGLVSVAFLAITVAVAYPFFLQLRLGGEFGARVADARRKLESLRRENMALERDVRRLKSRTGLEEALRDGGYGRSGELVLKVHTASDGRDGGRSGR
jgi:hypothetical protein